VARSKLVLFIHFSELLERVLANRLEHRQSWLALCRVHLEEALVEEGRQSLDDVETGAADRFGCPERPAAGEHGEACEQRTVGLVERLVAPLERLAQRLLSLGTITRAACQQRKPVVEASE
jgi:hypothetical protein